MALKATIYKFAIDLSNIDDNYYTFLDLTIAQHPSESIERMLVRLLAYCLNAAQEPEFTRGLSSTEEPDLWCKSLDGQIKLWIEVGEPNYDRVKKATQLSPAVKVFSFNRKSDVWWKQGQEKFLNLTATYYRFNNDELLALAGTVTRTQHLSVTIESSVMYIASMQGNFEVTLENLDT